MVVVTLKFLFQDGAPIVNGGEVFQGTGTNDAILQPPIGAFNFPFGLRRQSIDNLYAEEAQYLSPLRIHVVRFKNMLAPITIPALDEAKHAQVVHVIL